MSYSVPENWVVIFMNGDDPHYRILAGWSGGYATGSSWQMNSGITRVEVDEHCYYFYGASGSCYKCHKNTYGLRMNCAYIWNQLQEIHGDAVQLMSEDTDWVSMNWIIS